MTRLAEALMPHLLLAPILLPMLTGGLMLLLREEKRQTKGWLHIGSTTLGLVIAGALLLWFKQAETAATIGVSVPRDLVAPLCMSLLHI